MSLLLWIVLTNITMLLHFLPQDSRFAILWVVAQGLAWAHCWYLRSEKSTQTVWCWLSLSSHPQRSQIPWLSPIMLPFLFTSWLKMPMSAWCSIMKLFMIFVSELLNSQLLVVSFLSPNKYLSTLDRFSIWC